MKITGKIKDEHGEPLYGASVYVAGTTRGTASLPDGSFEVDAEIGDQLTISFVGFHTLKTPPIQANTLGFPNIILKENVEELPEVVVSPPAKKPPITKQPSLNNQIKNSKKWIWGSLAFLAVIGGYSWWQYSQKKAVKSVQM